MVHSVSQRPESEQVDGQAKCSVRLTKDDSQLLRLRVPDSSVEGDGLLVRHVDVSDVSMEEVERHFVSFLLHASSEVRWRAFRGTSQLRTCKGQS